MRAAAKSTRAEMEAKLLGNPQAMGYLSDALSGPLYTIAASLLLAEQGVRLDTDSETYPKYTFKQMHPSAANGNKFFGRFRVDAQAGLVVENISGIKPVQIYDGHYEVTSSAGGVRVNFTLGMFAGPQIDFINKKSPNFRFLPGIDSRSDAARHRSAITISAVGNSLGF